MRILINNEQIDYSLEGERNLGDILKELQNWLQKSGMTIDSFDINGEKTVPDEKGSWQDMNLSAIEELNIEAKLNREVEVEKLSAAYTVFQDLKDGIEKEGQSKIINASQTVLDTDSIPHAVMVEIAGKEGAESAAKIISGTGLSDGKIPEGEEKQKALTFIDNMCTILLGRLKELTAPKQEASASAGLLKGMVPQLNEISVLLQTGKDEEAMNLIIKFSELTQKLLRLFPYLQQDLEGVQNTQGKSFSYFAKDLNEKLNEVLQAFHDQDSVLIGDLMEYEITPCIDELVTFFPSVKQG
jgi:hypothetical protein